MHERPEAQPDEAVLQRAGDVKIEKEATAKDRLREPVAEEIDRDVYHGLCDDWALLYCFISAVIFPRLGTTSARQASRRVAHL